MNEHEIAESAKLEIVERLQNFHYKGDISDIGNEIGIVLGKLTKDQIRDFQFGLSHGISLSDGTH